MPKRKKHKQSSTHKHPVGDEKLENKPDLITIRGKVEAGFPPDLVERYDAGSKKQDSWDCKKFRAELATIVILSIYTTIAAIQGCLIYESNKINRESLESVQRAFVSVDEPTILRVTQDKDFVFYVRFPWDNSGSTPTKTLTTHVSWQAPSTPITSVVSLQDLWNKGEPHIDQQTFIAPHGNSGNNVGPIEAKVIRISSSIQFIWTSGDMPNIETFLAKLQSTSLAGCGKSAFCSKIEVVHKPVLSSEEGPKVGPYHCEGEPEGSFRIS